MQHYILVQWKDGADKNALSDQAEALFQKALCLPGIHAVQVKRACLTDAKRHDLMICITMEKSALAAHDQSEFHARWKAVYAPPFIAHKTIFDCD